MPPPVRRTLDGQLADILTRLGILETRPRGGGGGSGGSTAWADITGKPSTFPASAHTHPSSQITDFATAVPAAMPAASDTVAGKVELATDLETQTGTDGDRAVTPLGLNSRTATTGRTGLVELSTLAEAIAGTDAARAVTPAALTAALLGRVYPVGSIFMSTVNTNPGTYLGGTWVAWGTGRVPVGVDTGQTEFNTVEKTGGAKTHTLTEQEMPSHRHGLSRTGSLPGGGYEGWVQSNLNTGEVQNTNFAGGNQPHNNLQPYITCYMWKRTA